MKQLLHYIITHLPFYSFAKDFIRCGIAGWCLEIIFTAFHAFRRRDMALRGSTSLFMFPIYGSIALLRPIFKLLKNTPLIFRGLTYASLIFLGEYLSGTFLAKRDLCPWNYRRSKWQIKEVIRLDFLPFWFLTGLLFEKLLTTKQEQTSQS